MKYIIFLLLFVLSTAQTLSLTPEEEDILKKTDTLKCVSTGAWAPFNLLEKGRPAGIGHEYWTLIRQRLHLQNSCRIVKNWNEVLREIEQKKADMTIATQPTPKRLKYARFSKPYVTYPIVIVTKNDVGFIDNLDLLKGKTIAVGEGYAVAYILKKDYPQLKTVSVESIDKALELIDKGEVFATIEILPVVAYKLNKDEFYDLKISGSIPEHFPLSIMVGKEHEALLPLIDKAIDTITKEERDRINKRWITIHYDKRVSGKYFYMLLALFLFVLLAASLWLFVLKREIKEKERMEQRLKHLAHLDSLTSICNRYMLDVTLDKEIALSKRYGTPLSIIFFDIDGFKKINDGYGHDVGDAVLSELSRVVSNAVRESDILGRWGGDEFLLILPGTEEENAVKLAEELNRLIEKHVFKKHLSIHCTFGVTSYKEGDNRQTIMSRVDKYFYAAKKQKREEARNL